MGGEQGQAVATLQQERGRVKEASSPEDSRDRQMGKTKPSILLKG